MRRDGTLFQTATSSCHAPPPPPPAPPFTLLPPSIRALLRPAGLEQIRDGRVVAGAPVQAGVHALPPTEDERAALPEHVFVADRLDGGEILRGGLQVLVELPPALGLNGLDGSLAEECRAHPRGAPQRLVELA